MLTSVQRIRVYVLAIVVAVVAIGILFNTIERSRANDVVLLAETRAFAYALERYKEDFWSYPVSEPRDLRGFTVLSENGFAPGSTHYYAGEIPGSKPVAYTADGDAYQISFSLRHSWKEQGVASKDCIIVPHYRLNCSESVGQ